MTRRLLIANRGEIACRIIRSARDMGLHTIALHSEIDRSAPHVYDADEAVLIDSYLDIDAVIGAAKATGADAIHPGYGFLSERSAFAQAVEDAGITMVGPSARVMEQMGRKDAARKIAEEAGVAVVPSYDVEADAAGFDFPVLVKAAAGGGGKGMRIVRMPTSTPTQLPPPDARPSRPSATTPCSSRSTSSPVATSRCRCSPTGTATWSTSSSATAPRSVVTRRCSRRPPPRPSRPSSATR